MALEHSGVHMPKMHEERCLPFLGSARSLVRAPHQFMAGYALRRGLAEFADLYNASWLRERHGNKTPNHIRAEHKAYASDAATVFKMTAYLALQTVSQLCTGTLGARADQAFPPLLARKLD